MEQRERLALIVDAVNKVDAGQHEIGGFAIIRDKDCYDNYVQFMKTDGGIAIFEATSRDPEYGGILPPLTPDQVQLLARLGFDPIPDPNHRQHIALSNTSAIARITDSALTILGSAADCDIEIEYGDL